jgi:hypothetical protein
MAADNGVADLASAAEEWAETQLRRFEEAWRLGRRPVLAGYLPPTGPERHATLVELAHIDLGWRLQCGEPARAADYLASFPELARDCPAALSLIAWEGRLRCRLHPGSRSWA